jgi:hypothetical protein
MRALSGHASITGVERPGGETSTRVMVASNPAEEWTASDSPRSTGCSSQAHWYRHESGTPQWDFWF